MGLPVRTAPAVDVAAVARDLADVVLTAFGTAAAYGIDLDPVLAEVHRATLTQRHANAHGHARHGSEYSAPDVAAVLARQHDGSQPGDRAWWVSHILDAIADGDEDPAALEGLEALAAGWLVQPTDDLAGWAPWALITSGAGHVVWRHVADLSDLRDLRDSRVDAL